MSTLTSNKRNGILAMLAVAFLFACMDATSKILTQTYAPLYVVWARFAGQTVGTCLIFAPRLRQIAKTNNLGLQLLRSSFLFAATLCNFIGFSLMPFAEASSIYQVAPIVIVALAAVVLREKTRWFQWVAAAIGLAGALLIVQPGRGAFQWAAIFPLGGAVAFACFSIVTRFLSSADSVWTTFFYTTLVGAIVTSLLVPFVWLTPAVADLPLLLAIGAFGAVGQIMLIVAVRFAEASFVAPFLYFQLVWVALFGIFIFNETLSPVLIAGAVIIVAAGIVVQRGEALRVRQTAAAPQE